MSTAINGCHLEIKKQQLNWLQLKYMHIFLAFYEKPSGCENKNIKISTQKETIRPLG